MRARPRPSSGRPSGGARCRCRRGQGGAKAAHPGRPVEVWAADEHRPGLKPVRRRVWAPVGRRPIALGHHRYRRLHVVAFARETGAGRERHIVLVLDNAGWHGPGGLAVPEGISLVFLPPYTPELQPAERLWPLVDEAVANKPFASLDALDAAVGARCRRLDPNTVKPHTDFHWWPRPTTPN